MRLYELCQNNNNYVFNNDKVKEICQKIGFGNPFDVTKLDNTDKLPIFFKEKDICILHLGKGNHMFANGINFLYHNFENIDKIIQWEYEKSLLDEYNSSESNILSVANNQGILHDFLFNDLEFFNLSIQQRPKTYFPHRTKCDLNYYFGNVPVNLTQQQIEIDLTIEYDEIICIFEAKNGTPNNFNISQIYHPFLYYFNSNLTSRPILCNYLVRKENSIKLWCYTFEIPLRMDSIKFLKSCEYQLIKT